MEKVDINKTVLLKKGDRVASTNGHNTDGGKTKYGF